MTKLYCLETPEGFLIASTLSNTKSDVWGKSFDFVANRTPDFEAKYWKKWDASLAAAKKLGYKIIKVKLVKEEK